MTDVELGEWLQHCPTLYHMAERGSWPGIQQHGLLTTSALLELFDEPEPRRGTLEGSRRPESVALHHPKHGSAVVRDQKPMNDAALRRCLQEGLPLGAWYRLLNGRVFFWLTRERLLRLLKARPYSALEHDVLELDAAPLVHAHRAAITLSPINSGSTFALGPAPRGLQTFQPIAEFDYAGRRRTRPPKACVVELTVEQGLDVRPFVKRVVAMQGDLERGMIWARPVSPTLLP